MDALHQDFDISNFFNVLGGDDLWLVVVSICCFDIIGIYYFNWITRQFKFSQYILDYIDTSDELYIVNRQGKKEDN